MQEKNRDKCLDDHARCLFVDAVHASIKEVNKVVGCPRDQRGRFPKPDSQNLAETRAADHASARNENVTGYSWAQRDTCVSSHMRAFRL